MKWFWITATAIPGVALIIYWSVLGSPVPELIKYSSPEWLTFIGTLLSYLGLIFSSFAAIKVNELSNRYFAKARFPEIRVALKKITGMMAKSANKTAEELRSEDFIAQIVVFLRSIRRIKGNGMESLVQRAEKEHETLLLWTNSPMSSGRKANDETSYWNLFRALNEISEEIGTYLKEQEAR